MQHEFQREQHAHDPHDEAGSGQLQRVQQDAPLRPNQRITLCNKARCAYAAGITAVDRHSRYCRRCHVTALEVIEGPDRVKGDRFESKEWQFE